jgi:hypothetical protein
MTAVNLLWMAGQPIKRPPGLIRDHKKDWRNIE